jgi:pimeloyl-ACP methyl ester carboxylesterase
MPKKQRITRSVTVAGSIDIAARSARPVRLDGLVKVRERHAVRVDPARALATPATIEVADDDVLEIELEGGARLWTTLPQLHRDFPGAAVPRGLDSGTLDIPTALPIGSPTRGIGTWAIKALKVLGVDVTGTVAGRVAKTVEDRMLEAPGLYRCGDAAALTLQPVSAESVTSEQPLLVFIHGTGSNTDGSFGRLWHADQSPVLQELRRVYGNRILAFEHRTLTESPIENAVQLLEALPSQARVHLVTHSRGGLVGELLCRGSAGFDDADRKRMEVPRQRAALDELSRLLATRQPVIERFVRVACPVRGTTLASERLDRWLSVFVNLLSFAGLEGNPIFDLISDLTLAVVKERTDPRTLPGLEAMLPDSALVRLLNRADVRVTGDLTVLAGDAEGEGIWAKLKLLIPDLFYREDHDLVVNTSAMYGGARRTAVARHFFDQGPEVNHFNYFRNRATVERLLLGLTHANGFEARFETLQPSDPGIARGARRSGDSARPIVFVLPGIMGSHLAVDTDRVWIDVLQLAVGGIQKLRIDAPQVTAEAVVGSYYADLIEYLERVGGHEVLPFPFDWRRSLGTSAKALADAVSAKLFEAEATQQPLRIIAHSMGGLVARTMIADHPDIWKRLCAHPGGRLIMLGTPNAGSYVIPRLLLGHERLLKLFTVADFAHDKKELLDIFARYPGILEMLPVGGEFDLFSEGAWQRLEESLEGDGWVVPSSDGLVEARRTRSKLDRQTLDPTRVVYVAGCARTTPIDLELDGKAGVRFLGTWRGDGRVPWDGGIPNGIQAWYADTEHGNLAAYEPAFGGLLDLLRTGETTRLASAPPSAPRGVTDRFEIPADPLQVYPDEQEVLAASIGARRRGKHTRRQIPTRVWLTYGDLRETVHPVFVGHYLDDSIVSAEAAIDRRFDGRLRQHHQLGLYPGEIGTAEVFVAPGKKPRGAVVVGLGKVGELTPGGLTATIAHGVIKYVAAVLEQQRQRPAGKHGPEEITVAFLLVGSGDGGLSVSDSIVAILDGVLRARRMLAEARIDQRVVIEGVELIELWEDRVIVAARALRLIENDPQRNEWFAISPAVQEVRGGERRLTFAENGPWWQRLQIADDDGALRFTELTDRARAPVSLVSANRSLVDRFIESATQSVATDPEVATTLFELLLPNELKERAPDHRDLVLVLDEEAARYPWELMQDRTSPDRKPLAVQAGMLRQLETTVYRQRPLPSATSSALVVGDPDSNFAALPGAEEEAQTVHKLLHNSAFEVTAVIRGSATEIVNALHARPYQILHLAGHGVYDYPTTTAPVACELCGQPKATGGSRCPACGHPRAVDRVSGMVLGDGLFLTAGDVEQMRRIPDLVFINCCYLGKGTGSDLRANRHLLAANLAAQFIRMGVRAVVAAGWEVEDTAARIFAETFYTEMLGGRSFGEAVSKARDHAYCGRHDVNTWGAYQCYGPPDFRLAGTHGDAVPPSEHPPAVASEVITAVKNIASKAATAAPEEFATLSENLSLLIAKCQPRWLDSAELLAGLGRACGELDRFDEAVKYYKAALGAKKATLPVQAIEQLANLEARWAVAQWRSSKRARGPLATLKNSADRITALLQLGSSVERLALLGSVHKRSAWVTTGPRRLTALRKMVEAYGKAHKEAIRRQDSVDPYPAINWLVAQWLLQWYDDEATETLDEEIARWLPLAEAAAAEGATSPDFWSRIHPIDCALLRHLVIGDLGEHVPDLVAAYRAAQGLGATLRDCRSLLDQFEFIIDILRTGKTDVADQVVEALEAIRDQIA